jgi:hypothetical protein
LEWRPRRHCLFLDFSPSNMLCLSATPLVLLRFSSVFGATPLASLRFSFVSTVFLLRFVLLKYDVSWYDALGVAAFLFHLSWSKMPSLGVTPLASLCFSWDFFSLSILCLVWLPRRHCVSIEICSH